jgi:hypothetical protein
MMVTGIRAGYPTARLIAFMVFAGFGAANTSEK